MNGSTIIKIYGSVLSRANRCLWVLEELGLDYEHLNIDPRSGETRSAAYLALNPSGKVPVMVEEKFVLTESMAITRYLAGKLPTRLLPADPVSRAKIDQWTLWAVTEVEPFATLVVREMRLGDSADPGLTGKCKEHVSKALETIESCLTDSGDYLMGDNFCLADLNVAAVVYMVPVIGIDMETAPRTSAWLQRCLKRPAWLKLQDL